MTDFIEHLSRLAPEGETFLLTRQKPQLKGGEVQCHPEGAIKATWPAMLPTAKIKPEWAIYGNTASFILERFSDGHVSARADNCEYVLVMVLDDVGDPAKAPVMPPLEPTWKMETSPGSYQWGYAFGEQPTKGEYGAAIRAIAARRKIDLVGLLREKFGLTTADELGIRQASNLIDELKSAEPTSSPTNGNGAYATTGGAR